MKEKDKKNIVVFARVLKKIRTDKLITQEALALKSGLDRTYISLLERGERQPTLSTILKLSKVLKVSGAEIVRRVEKELKEMD